MEVPVPSRHPRPASVATFAGPQPRRFVTSTLASTITAAYPHRSCHCRICSHHHCRPNHRSHHHHCRPHHRRIAAAVTPRRAAAAPATAHSSPSHLFRSPWQSQANGQDGSPCESPHATLAATTKPPQSSAHRPKAASLNISSEVPGIQALGKRTGHSSTASPVTNPVAGLVVFEWRDSTPKPWSLEQTEHRTSFGFTFG